MISTLLFVNNNHQEQQLLKSCLKKLQQNIYLISAYSCADAFRILSIVAPDAIVLDVSQLNTYDAIINNAVPVSGNKIPLFILSKQMMYEKTGSTPTADGMYVKPTTGEEYKNILDKIIDRLNEMNQVNVKLQPVLRIEYIEQGNIKEDPQIMVKTVLP